MRTAGISVSPREHRHRGHADGEAEDRHPDRQRDGDERAEREEQDRDRGEQADQLASAGAGVGEGEEQVAAHLDAQRQLAAQPVAEGVEVVEVVGLSAGSVRVLHADEGDPTVGRDHAAADGGVRAPAAAPPPGRWCRARAGVAAPRPAAAASAARAAPASKNVAPLVDGGDDDLGGDPLLTGAGPLDQVRGPLGVQSWCGQRVREPPAEGGSRAPITSTAASSHAAITSHGMTGGAATQSGEGVREHRVLQPAGWSSSRGRR